MDNKKLIQLYLENVEKMFGYANMEAYMDRRLQIWKKILSEENKEREHRNFFNAIR